MFEVPGGLFSVPRARRRASPRWRALRSVAAGVFTIVLALVLAGLTVAGAAMANTPTKCAVSVDVSDASAGLRVSGAGFAGNQPFTIYLKPEVVAKPVTDPAGRFDVRVTLPSADTGTQTLQVEGAGCAVELTFSGRPDVVTDPAVQPPVQSSRLPALPFSPGISVSLIAGVAALAVGMFVLVGRAGRRNA